MIRFALGALALLVAAGPSVAQQHTNIAAARFVDPVSVRSADLSPSGTQLAYIQRNNTTQFVVVADLAARSGRQIMQIQNGEGQLNWVSWKGDGRLIVSATVDMVERMRAQTGSNRHQDDIEYTITRVIAVNPDGSNIVQMFEGRMRSLLGGLGSTFLLDDLPSQPGHVLLSAWDNNGHGVWRADVATGRVERIADGTWDTAYYAADGAGNPVIRMDVIRAGYRISRQAPGERGWTSVFEARRTATATNSPDFEVLGAGPAAGQVYVIARPDGRDRAALYMFNATTGELGAPLQEGAAADVSTPWINPVTRELFATCEFAARLSCRTVDRAMQRHLNAVNSFFGDAVTIHLADMSQDMTKWLLYVEGPRESGGYYIYDRTAARVDVLASLYPSLDASALSPTQVVTYRARDGAELWAYVTAQEGATGPRPMVLLPHGGPEARDYFGYYAYAQFLASRGYVVVQPNFRGSSGFGRAFADAGRGQWGRMMQDDLTDAVRHMVDSGVADRDRVCIVGASYGGYAALAGVTLTPDLYRCAIAISAPTDLLEMLREERADGGSNSRGYIYWTHSIGDPRANRDAIIAASPARHAASIAVPVLLVHGEDDDIVPIDQSERMERALREAGRAPRFVRLADSGHFWDGWNNESRLTVFRESEAFLGQHLAPR